MGETTVSTPKSLVKVKNEPIIEKQINVLKKCLITDINLVTGYLSYSFNYLNLSCIHNDEWESSNMVYGLMKADNLLSKYTTIISYGDIFYKEDVLHKMINCNYNICLAYDVNWLSLWRERFGDPLKDAETFRVSDDGFITEIGNKPKDISSIKGQYMGLFKTTPYSWFQIKEIYKSLPLSKQMSISVTEILSIFIDTFGPIIYGIENNEEWGELDTFKDLELYDGKNN